MTLPRVFCFARVEHATRLFAFYLIENQVNDLATWILHIIFSHFAYSFILRLRSPSALFVQATYTLKDGKLKGNIVNKVYKLYMHVWEWWNGWSDRRLVDVLIQFYLCESCPIVTSLFKLIYIVWSYTIQFHWERYIHIIIYIFCGIRFC